MRPRIVAVYLLCCAVWGSTWVVIAAGLRDLPPLLFAGSRMLVAAALLAPVTLPEVLRLESRVWRRLAGLGVLQIALPYGLMFAGQQWTPSSLAAILFASFPVWVAILGRAVLGERLTRRRAVAVTLGVLGVLVLQSPSLRRLSASGPLALASTLILAASISAALANVLAKRYTVGRVSPLAMVFAQALPAGALLLAGSAMLERGRPAAFTLSAMGAVAYLAVCGTVLTYGCLYWLLPRVPLSFVATIPLLDTTLAVCLGALLLRERLGWHLALGGAMVLGAAVLAGLPARRAVNAGQPASVPA